MVFDLIVSALITVLVVTLTDGILTFFGNGLMNIGYRSAWIGPGGLRPSVRTMILTAAALLSFCLTFYFLMRETIRYIGKILEKVKEILLVTMVIVKHLHLEHQHIIVALT